MSRATELKVSLPDPSLLVAAIDKLRTPTLASNNSMSFRISSFRYDIQVDTIPTHDGVDKLS